ncbi:hypothetical protein VTJ83DRAFT_879 [Remersonia thermophila]|uniref:Uncharacterized protein n=1 Tax=Remersonia thermophila TaxID=72144 RepID=A0ABR4DMG9_9PEZI
MSNRNARRPSSRWTWWQVLTSATAASAISFSNIQPLMDGASVSLGCTLAYSTDLQGCRISDFQQRVCPAVCVRSLTRAVNAVQAACVDANVPRTSLLGQVLAGRVVALLCPGTASTTVTPTTSRTTLTEQPTGGTSTRAVFPITSTLRNTGGPLTFTTFRSATTTTTTTPTSSSSPEETGVNDGDGDDDDDDDNASTSTRTSSVTTDRGIQTTLSETPTTVTSTDPVVIPPTERPIPDANDDDDDSGNSSGGGSPFDFVSTSDAQRLPRAHRTAAWTAALGLGWLLLL